MDPESASLGRLSLENVCLSLASLRFELLKIFFKLNLNVLGVFLFPLVIFVPLLSQHTTVVPACQLVGVLS